MSSCLAWYVAHETSSADHPVGLVFTSTTAPPAGVSSTSTADAARLHADGSAPSATASAGASRSVDTWDDLRLTAEPHIFLTSVFLDVFTALQLLFGYLTLTLWNYLSAYRDVLLARYAEDGGQCYVQCDQLDGNTTVTTEASLTATTITWPVAAAVDASIVEGRAGLCPVDAGCGEAPGLLAALYLGVVCASLTLATGITLFTAALNSPCVVRWRERRWLASHSDERTLPLISLSGPHYLFSNTRHWRAVDGMVSRSLVRTRRAARARQRRRSGGEDTDSLEANTDDEGDPNDDRVLRHSADLDGHTRWYRLFILPDSKAPLFWLFSPLVLVLVVFDGILLSWSRAHPQFSRFPTASSASWASAEVEGTVTVLQGAVLAFGIALLLYTVRIVVWRSLLCCVRALFGACFWCVAALNERLAA